MPGFFLLVAAFMRKAVGQVSVNFPDAIFPSPYNLR
jgi:hypothetical protein